MSRSLTCKISGKTFTFSQDYYSKKIDEYGSVDNLTNFFVTKKVKSLIKRGYEPQEIRNILHVDSDSLQDASEQSIRDVITFHSENKINIKKIASLASVAYKTDPDVAVFINNIRNE
jgi:hypothetical protein